MPARQVLPTEVRRLAEKLGVSVGDALFAQALSHRSWCAETMGQESNERLEFLGDAVLGLAVTDHIYRTYPGLPEGELAKVRAAVVSSAVLAELATQHGLGEVLRLGKGEDASGGRHKQSILADTMEAVIGAVYLEEGMAKASSFVLALLGERIARAATGPGAHDYKTQLQELVARRYEQMPRYRVRDEGPDHAKRFFATVVVDGAVRGSGEGPSKKQAEQEAARAAWGALTVSGPVPAAAPEGPVDA